MAFKEEIDDAISCVVWIRKLIELSRPSSLVNKKTLDDEKEQARRKEEVIQAIRNKNQDAPLDKVVALAYRSTPSEIGEINQKLERIEFLLEDMRRGKDKKSNLQFLINSFQKSSIEVYDALMAIQVLRQIIERH